MILACPECGTKYTIPEAAFGAKGRTFRCASCKHTWFEKSPLADTQFEPPLAPADRPDTGQAPAFSTDDAPSSSFPAHLPGRYHGGKESLRPLCVFLLILLVILAPLAYRKAILKNHPSLEGIYSLFNIYNSNGLTLSDVKMTKTPLDGKLVRVRIDCSVTNESKEKRTLPKLIEYLVNSDGADVLKTGSMVETGNRIEPGDTVSCKPFSFDMKENEIDSVRLDLSDGLDLTLRHKQ